MGGYLEVLLENRWKEIAKINGLADEDEEELKECYKKYLYLVKCYYQTTLRPGFMEEPIKNKTPQDGVESSVHGDGCVEAKDEMTPQDGAGSSIKGLEAVGIDTSEEDCENLQGKKSQFGVTLEGNDKQKNVDTDVNIVGSKEKATSNQEDTKDEASTLRDDDFVIIM